MWIYLLLLLVVVVGNCNLVMGQIKRVCNRQKFNITIEIHCNAIPLMEEFERLDFTTSTLTITCQQLDDKLDTKSNIEIKNLQRLTYIYIGNCMITDLRRNYFENMTKLQTVYFENLPIENFTEDLFKNSSNIVDLILSGFKKLKTMHPKFLGDQNRLESLTLSESNIDPLQLRPILLTVYPTFANLHWRKNRLKISLSKTYFQHFQFDNLMLEYNGIDNVEFLEHMTAKILSLKGNPIGKIQRPNWSNFQRLSKKLERLDLSETGVDLQPDMKFPYLEELVLSNNNIEQLPDRIEYFLPKLRLLDVRYNKLTTLPSLDYMLRIKFGQVSLDGNLFNCNCEMMWIRKFDSSRIRDISCANIPVKKGEKRRDAVFSRKFKFHMTCSEPNLRLELNDQFKTHDYTITSNPTKVYRFDIYPDDVISWKCIGEGNPAPKLKWIKNQQTLKTQDPPINRNEKKTVMNNLLFPLNNFNLTQDNESYTCKGTSIAGSSEIKIEVSKKFEKRSQIPMLAQIYSNKSTTKILISLELNLTVLFFIYFF